MTSISRFISGVLSTFIVFLLGLVSTVRRVYRKAFVPTRTIYLSRQQRRHMARVRANDYARTLRHLPRKWRRKVARNLAKSIYTQTPKSMTVEV
jgi:hypothetical protein